MSRAKDPSRIGGESKRQNFNISPEQEAEIAWLREAMDAPSTKDVVLRSVRVLSTLVREAQTGRRLYLGTADGTMDRLIIPELEPNNSFQYLVERPHAWRRQLYVKGRRLLASTVWADMQSNGHNIAEAADDWDLPLEAIEEIVRYCEGHQRLIGMEADEERHRLEADGVSLTARVGAQ